MIPLTKEVLNRYFLGALFHRAYTETVTLYNQIKTHADGVTPMDLIGDRRPSESLEILEYRKKIYVPITKNPIGKVLNSLSKIRRSPEWSIKYDRSLFPQTILPEETLESYCEQNYPGHKSLTNWIFSVLLKINLVDANAVIAVIPTNLEAAKNNEYYKPIAIVFNSPQVCYFEEGAEFAVLKSSERSSLIPLEVTTNNLPMPASVFYVLTTTEYAKWEQDPGGSFTRTQYLKHDKNILPVFKVRSNFLKQKENAIIQESRLSLMLPFLDEAAREYSDLQASKVQHMYPLFWYYSSKECNHCNGTGKVVDLSEGSTSLKECTHCKGSGKIKFSPYAHLEVDPPKIGEQATPAPPAGYVSRDVDIIKHQEESVEKHLYNALSAVNMQFIDQTPLNISGTAKQVDREELNNFVFMIAEDLVATMDSIYSLINEWRYSVIVPDAQKRKAMCPKIVVPENYDLLPTDYLMEEIGKGKSSKVNPILIASLEEDYIVKKFYNNPERASELNCYYELDPLLGYSVDEKMTLLGNKGVTLLDFVISAYIVNFVKRALQEEKGFIAMSYDDQVKLMVKYADEKIKTNDIATQIKQDLLAEQLVAQQQQQPPPNPGNGGGLIPNR